MEEELEKLLIGINRIYYEMEENHLGFYSIDYNSNRNHNQNLPNAMLLLMKIHYTAYILEITKIVVNGDNHFLISKALNLLHKIKPQYANEIREWKKQFRYQNDTIFLLKKARNNIYAHLDENFYDFRNNLDNLKQIEINKTIQKSIDFLNEKSNLDSQYRYNFWEKTDILKFYNLVYTQVVNSNISNELK